MIKVSFSLLISAIIARCFPVGKPGNAADKLFPDILKFNPKNCLTDFRKSIMMGRNRRQAVCKRRRGYGQGVMGIAKCGFIASFFVAVKKKEREK